jgi:tryptophanyl-tRNA synthetase
VRVGRVFLRARCTVSAPAIRLASRSSASSRLRRCERVSWATARTTGPQRAITLRFCSSVSVEEAATSKLASIREAVTFACCPPGPDERLARTSTSSGGIVRPGRTSSTSLVWRAAMRIFSGIQPTGRKHLGNYIGAMRQYVEGQERGDPAIFCVVDLHATSVAYDAKALPGYVLDTTAMLIAAGLDPSRCILFRQSDVKEHTELCWLLCASTAYGDLQRMHQFKEKSAREQQLVRTSLFLYPVLQAADILAYNADEVPVGDDQRQHVELTRDIAERFNASYGEVFVLPEHRIPAVGARVMDLQDPTTKMSTTYSSDAGLIFVDDDADSIRKKVKRAQTDSGSEVRRGDGKEGIANLIEIMSVVRDVDPAEVERDFEGQGYGAFKEAVGDAVVELLAPVRERYAELRADERALEATLQDGAGRARAIASGTLAETRAAMGVGPAV